MADPTVTVFGGTGFLGRRVVHHLVAQGCVVRSASRHAERGRSARPAESDAVVSIAADVNDEGSVGAALAGAGAAVNAVSLYVERGRDSFRSVHVEAAARVARHARQAGVARLVHVSGIGADPASDSPYVRSRGEGEQAVREAFPGATLIRPAVMFGPDDAFLVPLSRLLRRLPAFALFGRGRTRLQPAYVDDVAEAIARVLRSPQAGITYELAGPKIYSYRGLLELVAAQLGRRSLLVPMPFALWHVLAHVAELLPAPPVTRNQVQLMRQDNVAAADAPGFQDLRMAPRAIEELLPLIVS